MKEFYVQTEDGVTICSFNTIEDARKFRDNFSAKLVIVIKKEE